MSDMSSKLINEVEDIEAFNLIIQMMEPFVSKTIPEERIINWEIISQNMIEFGYSDQHYSHIKCQEKFYSWSKFYAKVCHKFLLAFFL